MYFEYFAVLRSQTFKCFPDVVWNCALVSLPFKFTFLGVQIPCPTV